MNHTSKKVKAIDRSILEQQINRYITSEPLLTGALIGISIRYSSTGDKIYENLGDIRLRPASNMKLLSGAAALSTLGEDYTFSTEVLTDGNVRNNTLYGNLYLKGKGDPTLLSTDFDTFAEKVRESGVKVIEGDIIGDDSWYDDVRLSADLNWSDEHFYYGAQVSALTASPNTDFDAGSVIVEVIPGNVIGGKPTIVVSPETDYIEIVNKAKTVAPNVEEGITINRKHGVNVITIEGIISVKAHNVREWISVWEPTGFALDLFQQALNKQGVTWTGEVKNGLTLKNTEKLFSHQSIPLSELLVPFMKLSNMVLQRFW